MLRRRVAAPTGDPGSSCHRLLVGCVVAAFGFCLAKRCRGIPRRFEKKSYLGIRVRSRSKSKARVAGVEQSMDWNAESVSFFPLRRGIA